MHDPSRCWYCYSFERKQRNITFLKLPLIVILNNKLTETVKILLTIVDQGKSPVENDKNGNEEREAKVQHVGDNPHLQIILFNPVAIIVLYFVLSVLREPPWQCRGTQ